MMESDVPDPVPRIVHGLYINELEKGPQHGMASSYLVLGQSFCLFPFGTMSLVFFGFSVTTLIGVVGIQCVATCSPRKSHSLMVRIFLGR